MKSMSQLEPAHKSVEIDVCQSNPKRPINAEKVEQKLVKIVERTESDGSREGKGKWSIEYSLRIGQHANSIEGV
jgi:hypothetical protein